MNNVVRILDNMLPGEKIYIDKLKNKGLTLNDKEQADFVQVVKWYCENGWDGKYEQIDLSIHGNMVFKTTVKGFKRKKVK